MDIPDIIIMESIYITKCLQRYTQNIILFLHGSVQFKIRVVLIRILKHTYTCTKDRYLL